MEPNFPPVIEGVTSQPHTSGIGQLLQSLLFSGGGGAETSLEYIKKAIALLEKAARQDPRIGPRVAQALEMLDGNRDGGGSDRSGTSRRGPEVIPKIAPMMGNIKSPI